MKRRARFSLSLFLALALLVFQAGRVFAAPALQNPAPVSGAVQSITLEANTVTGVTIVLVDVIGNDETIQSVRISLETALDQGLVVLDGDGNPVINDSVLGKPVEIPRSSLIPAHGEDDHPIATALATFFADVDGIDYETIMAAHEQGVGFGTLAQILWLTTKLEGDAETFAELVHAKQTGDFSSFSLEDGTTPENWGQLRKAILGKDKKNGLGVIISDSNNPGNENHDNPENNGNGIPGGNNGQNPGGGNGDGNGNKDKGNGNGKDK